MVLIARNDFGLIKKGMRFVFVRELKEHIETNCAELNMSFNLSKEILGYKGKLLTENLEVTINFHNENPLSISLPNQLTCVIETTDVALKGQTVSSSYKPAILKNGLSIQVPPFIESGDKILLDTRTMEYVKKI